MFLPGGMYTPEFMTQGSQSIIDDWEKTLTDVNYHTRRNFLPEDDVFDELSASTSVVDIKNNISFRNILENERLEDDNSLAEFMKMMSMENS